MALQRVLELIGIEYYSPTFQQRMPRGKAWVVRPWFPGYMFLHFCVTYDYWHQIQRAPGAIGILGDPTPLDEAIYHDMIMRCPSEVFVNDAYTVIPAGSEVEILKGAFSGKTGIVAESRDATVWVETLAFNRPTRVELSTKDVMILR
jgi:transcription antitermination factor NusG